MRRNGTKNISIIKMTKAEFFVVDLAKKQSYGNCRKEIPQSFVEIDYLLC